MTDSDVYREIKEMENHLHDLRREYSKNRVETVLSQREADNAEDSLGVALESVRLVGKVLFRAEKTRFPIDPILAWHSAGYVSRYEKQKEVEPEADVYRGIPEDSPLGVAVQQVIADESEDIEGGSK